MNLIAKVLFPSLFFLLLTPQTSYSSKPEKEEFFVFNAFERKAYNYLLELQFNEARDILKTHKNSSLNPKALYIANLVDVTEIYLTENPLLYEQYQQNEKLRLQAISDLHDNNPVKLFLQAEIKIHWAFAKLRFGHKLAAFRNLQQAYNLITKNQKQHSGFIPNYKSLGVLHTLFDSFPDNYSWIPNLFGLEGNTLKGMEELKKVSTKHDDLKIETLIYSAVFDAFLLNNKQDAIETLERTINNHQELRSIEFILAILYIKNSQSSLAQPLLAGFGNNKISNGVLQLSKYYLAETCLQKGAYNEALDHYQSFIESYTGTSYIKDAYLKIAICYYLMEQDQYKRYLELAEEKGSTTSEIDKNAERILENKTLPHKSLLKVRYATDGGYKTLADSILNQLSYQDFPLLKDKTEYYYRKARLYHKQDLIMEAEGYYLKTIFTQSYEEWYFAPNSCLQLGYIYSNRGEFKKAVNYFNKSKTYKNHPYKYSIDKKADIGIERCTNENK